MSIVNFTEVRVLDNPTSFTAPFRFEITFDVISELREDLEFKLIYVGSPQTEQYDQVLESVMVGPVPVGINQFILEADAPKVELLPPNDVVGVTVVLLICSYREREFIRVGYYVNNDYVDEQLRENPPAKPEFDKLERNTLADKPRVTRLNIPWDQEDSNTSVVGSAIPQEFQRESELVSLQSGLFHGGDSSMFMQNKGTAMEM